MNEFENVVVTDKRKIEEIKQALQSTESSFEHIKPAEPDKLPENAKVLFNGDNYGYVHIEKDDSIISFDDSSLDDDYYYDGQLKD